ncbi:sensor histidine kinase [Alkalihalobacillus pseudalcaliphilus]|uniref:sensor histidine kinase n=1 Tax=Alkalihalobacillus pseudalcaliphilus TaxID=79884 RepID=UPI00064E0D28|nr:histidine kinase [Alkalihalobacillus pseudalcaliphilus]KMK75175.1 histidine kinase [Alkalihalobacillus pseudalcaliphilus]
MNTIQKKIMMLASIALVIMVVFWIALSVFHQKTQDQYNDILQRYISMNEVSRASQQVIIDANNYMIMPTSVSLEQLQVSQESLDKQKEEVLTLRNKENQFALTNYVNMIDSFLETMERLLIFMEDQDAEGAAYEFSEASRISTYLSEQTLALIDQELNSYAPIYRGMIEQSEDFFQLGLWFLLLSSCAFLLISYLLSSSITKPVQKLTKAANDLSNGIFDTRIEVETKDEMAFLAKTFERMRVNINNLFHEIKEKASLESELQENRILLKESQFRSLQSQIQPHFLFNTLNIMSKKAYLEGAEETSDLLVSVAGLLRYNLKQIDRAVTIREEIGVIEQYMHIQKTRFKERLRLETEIDPSCFNKSIPVLTLQPIIENAVIHAIEPNEEGGTIWLRVFRSAEEIFIEIEDNGPGMSESTIKQIMNEEITPSIGHSTGIGFMNVVKRLRLFYGYRDVIDIESHCRRGTVIRLKVGCEGGAQCEAINR